MSEGDKFTALPNIAKHRDDDDDNVHSLHVEIMIVGNPKTIFLDVTTGDYGLYWWWWNFSLNKKMGRVRIILVTFLGQGVFNASQKFRFIHKKW